jgi:O-antigen/teichoic acid export membrane protein
VYFRKNLDFHKQFVLEIVPVVVYLSVVIPLAFFLKTVWALVWATLATSVTTCVISYMMHPYRPRLEFETKKARELFNFGKWILGSSIIVMVREQGVTMFVGKFLSMSSLGFYNRACAFSTVIFQQINEIVWKVGYPAYSQLQASPERFRQVNLKTLKLLTFIGMPMAGGLFVLSKDFVHLFLTDKWLSIVPLMQILCLQAILDFINTPAGIAFQALGRPAIGSKIAAFGVIILAISIYPLSSKWGISGTVASLLLSSLIPTFILSYMAIKVMECPFLEFIKPIAFSLISTGVMFFAVVGAKKYLITQMNVISFIELVLVGMFVYTAITYILDRCTNDNIYGLIRERITDLRRG